MFAAEKIKARILKALQPTIDTAEKGERTFEAAVSVKKLVDEHISRAIDRYACTVAVREAELKVREEACVRVVVEYQKRIGELELQIPKKEEVNGTTRRN